jgi:hypothetical protein
VIFRCEAVQADMASSKSVHIPIRLMKHIVGYSIHSINKNSYRLRHSRGSYSAMQYIVIKVSEVTTIQSTADDLRK